AVAGIALRVFVAEHRAERAQHLGVGVVLRRDQLDAALLPRLLAGDRAKDVGIVALEQLAVGVHGFSFVSSPRTGSLRCSVVGGREARAALERRYRRGELGHRQREARAARQALAHAAVELEREALDQAELAAAHVLAGERRELGVADGVLEQVRPARG